MPFARVFLYVATLGALALLARSILRDPVPLWVALVAIGAYLTLILCGVFFLRLGMFVDVIWRGPEEARGVALTFDDGPSPAHTLQILDLLDRARCKATFFVIGHKAEKHPEIVRAIVARGHGLGLHSYAHDRLFSLRSPATVRNDLTRAMDVIERITGSRPTLFRPPIGHTSPRIGAVVNALELTVVGWNVRALDGLSGARPDRVAARVIPKLKDGAIVLLHDAAERDDFEPASIAALPRILAAMKDRGLEGVRVEEWVEANGRTP